MQHLKLKTHLTLEALQQRIMATPPEGLSEFWLGSDGQHAMAETDAGTISVIPISEGLKLAQPAVTPRLRALAAWIQAQEPTCEQTQEQSQ